MKNIHHRFLFLTLLASVLMVVKANAQSVTIGALSSSSFCSGDPFSVSFTATGSFGSGNTFTLQLSDVSGRFSSFTNLASITDSLPGTFTITAAIPAVANAKHYRFRILSASPNMTSADNGSDIVIGTLPDVTISYQTSNGIGHEAVVAEGVSAQFTLSRARGGTPAVDSVFWDFGPDASPQTAAGGLLESVTYSSGGNKTGSVRIVVNGCGSRTIPFSVFVIGCMPQIPKYAIVVDSNMKAEDPIGGQTYWVNQGVSLDLDNCQRDTVFAEPGSVIAGAAPFCLIYLKAGAVLQGEGDGTTTIDSKGIGFGGGDINFRIGCDSLSFDYTNAPPNPGHILSVKSYAAPFSIEISPNPAAGSIKVSIAGNNSAMRYELYDALGIARKEGVTSNTSFQIDVSDLAAGNYYLRISEAGGIPVTKKIIILK